MKIDEDVIRDVLLSIDPLAKEDPEFIENIELFIYKMIRKQKKLNANKKRNNQTLLWR